MYESFGEKIQRLSNSRLITLTASMIAYAPSGGARRVVIMDITVGDWLEKFTWKIRIETSPRSGINASRNRPYSADSLENYEGYYRVHIKGDPLTDLKMGEKLGIKLKTVKKRLEAAKIRPLTKEAVYPAEALKTIRNIQMGRPKKQASSEAPSKPRKTSKTKS